MRRFRLLISLSLGGVMAGMSACGGGTSSPGSISFAVTSTDPPANAVGVQLDDPIVATFNSTVAPASVNANTFFVTDSAGNRVVGTLSTSGRTARFTPLSGALAKSTIYHVTLTTGITNLTGNTLAANLSGSFTTTTDAWTPTTVTSAPSARFDHTAVWTGSEMIAWGGTDGASLLNTGARYNPNTGWTATNTTGAPLQRTDHTAIWDGRDDEMIVWGGNSSVGLVNSGGIYAPASDTWASTSVTPLTALGFLPRELHTAVWTGTEMIVWGGQSNLGAMSDGARYNPATNTWLGVTLTNAPSARYGHTAVWTGTEMIVWGGKDGSGPFSDGARYNPVTNSWTRINTAGAPSARSGHTAVWTGNEMIVWGGDGGTGLLNDGARYDPTTNSWTPMSTVGAPSARSGHTAVWTGNEMIVWGGDGSTGPLDDGAAYNPTHDTWRTIANKDAPTARIDHTAVWTGKEMIVWGGKNGTVTSTGARYVP